MRQRIRDPVPGELIWRQNMKHGVWKRFFPKPKLAHWHLEPTSSCSIEPWEGYSVPIAHVLPLLAPLHASHPAVPSMLAPLLLASLISHILPLVAAGLHCHSAFHPAYSNTPQDQLLADCRQLVSHIPSLRQSFDEPPDARRLPPSSPFFPQATFRHGSCSVQISYHSSRRVPIADNATIGGMSTFLYADYQYYTPPILLLESTVCGIWNQAKAATSRVVEQCVANGHTGVEWGLLDVPEAPNAWYMADIRVVAVRGRWSRRTRTDAQRALRGELVRASRNMYREAFIDV